MKELTKSKIETFVTLFNRGVEAWTEAGKIVVELIDSDPEAIDRICKVSKVTPEMIRWFEKIGRRQLSPQLLLSDEPGIRKLRNLPIDLQEKHANEPIELLIRTEQGWETLLTDVRNLTPEQARQVFDRAAIRSEAAQRAYIEGEAMRKMSPPVQADVPYRLVGKKLVVMQPCTFTVSELAEILARAER